jgi:hypothetical protein
VRHSSGAQSFSVLDGVLVSSSAFLKVILMRQYLVLKRRGSWFAKSLGRFGAPYSSESRAIRGAVDRAQKSGKPATVALLKDHEQKLIWTFGQDPYPPVVLGADSKLVLHTLPLPTPASRMSQTS